MSEFRLSAVELSSLTRDPHEGLPWETAAVALPPWTSLEAPAAPAEPPTLALALVGLGTLAAFRAIQKATGPKAPAAAQPAVIKPRRRAA